MRKLTTKAQLCSPYGTYQYSCHTFLNSSCIIDSCCSFSDEHGMKCQVVQCDSGQNMAQYFWKSLEYSRAKVTICFLALSAEPSSQLKLSGVCISGSETTLVQKSLLLIQFYFGRDCISSNYGYNSKIRIYQPRVCSTNN